jgi:hypothetical protein
MLARNVDARFDEAKATHQLHLPYHRLRSIDTRVWALTQLTLLDLAHNSIAVLPPEIGGLVRLRELWINHNASLAALPAEIASCTELAVVDARFTALVKVPRDVARLARLHDLRLAGCEATLDIKQQGVYGAGGTPALLEYLATKAARSDAKLALSEVLIYQLYAQDAATDAGKARVLGLVKAVARSFPGLILLHSCARAHGGYRARRCLHSPTHPRV